MTTGSHALDTDTIAAIATPSGRGGICVIRLSGPTAKAIGEHIAQRPLTHRNPVVTRFFDQDNTAIDEGIALYFGGPASFTGEDVTELHGHGGVVIEGRGPPEPEHRQAREEPSRQASTD